MTTMKMQKLAFYAQAQSLAHRTIPLFPEDFQAWRGGPVSVPLYRLHRGKLIIRPGELSPQADSSRLTENDRSLIEGICAELQDWSGNQLSRRTHREKPWKQTRGDLDPAASSNAVIPQELIRSYYSAHPVIQADQ